MSLVPPDDAAVMELVRRELEVRRLVEKVLAEKKDEKESRGDFWKHPAVLLVLTFLFTGVIGSLLTTCWQDQQWASQERYRAADQATKERLDTINLATEAVAASCASAEDVLHLFFWKWSDESKVVTLQERSDHWRDQSRKWRVSEKVLRARIRSNFSDPKTIALLEEIINERRRLGNNITNLLWLADRHRMNFTIGTKKEIDDLSKGALDNVARITGAEGKLRELTAQMLKETEELRPKPTNVFERLVSLEADPKKGPPPDSK